MLTVVNACWEWSINMAASSEIAASSAILHPLHQAGLIPGELSNCSDSP